MRGGHHFVLADIERLEVEELVLVVGQRRRRRRLDWETEQSCNGSANLRNCVGDDGGCAVVVEGSFTLWDVDTKPTALQTLIVK